MGFPLYIKVIQFNPSLPTWSSLDYYKTKISFSRAKESTFYLSFKIKFDQHGGTSIVETKFGPKKLEINTTKQIAITNTEFIIQSFYN